MSETPRSAASPSATDRGAGFAALLGERRAGRLRSPAIVMGIVNVTPDSFSDGGLFFDADAAIAHGRKLAEEGAAILDIGGESTRGGAEAVSEEEEKRRVLPVIEALIATGALVSIDTHEGLASPRRRSRPARISSTTCAACRAIRRSPRLPPGMARG